MKTSEANAPIAVRQALNAEHLILKAIEQNVPIETMERLLAMREKLKQEQGREAYFAALSHFQADCPVITKSREVRNQNGSVRYRYANLDDISGVISPLLAQHGLSFTVKTEWKDKAIYATCEVHHVMGHTEASTFAVPIAEEGFMNDAQKAASAMTYAKRYALCNAFGIVTGDDDDAEALGKGVSPQDIYRRNAECMETTLEYIKSVMAIKDNIAFNNLSAAAEAWYELPDEIKMKLWLAPTKGGPFTTKERDIMKGDDFRIAYHGTDGEEKVQPETKPNEEINPKAVFDRLAALLNKALTEEEVSEAKLELESYKQHLNKEQIKILDSIAASRMKKFK